MDKKKFQPATDHPISLIGMSGQAMKDFLDGKDPFALFQFLLEELLDFTQSRYGLIGQVCINDQQSPYLHCYARSKGNQQGAAWPGPHNGNHHPVKLDQLDSLYGKALTTGQVVMTNKPGTDPRSAGLPQDISPLFNFIGIPIRTKQGVVGMIGLANKLGGYQPRLLAELDQVLITCAVLFRGYSDQRQLRQLEHQLKHQLAAIDNAPGPIGQHSPERHNVLISLDHGYTYCPRQQRLSMGSRGIDLTRKELGLVSLLIGQRNELVGYQAIDQHIWPNVIVTESSRRCLLKRLRRKIPGLTITTVSGMGYRLEVDS